MTLSRQERHKARTAMMPGGERAHVKTDFTARCIRVIHDDRPRDVTRPLCSADGSYHVPGCPLYQAPGR